MGLTRPTVAQLNTVVTEISDPVTVLNKGSTLANVDVGFVFNRDSGISTNVALYWNETIDSIVVAYTTSTGGVNSNIAISSYANLTVGNITSSGNVSAAQINSATAVVTGSTYVGELFVTTRAADEGGQIQLATAVTNTTLSGNITIDVYQNKLRIWESGGTNRGGYFDISGLSAGVGTNLAAGGGGGTPGGGEGQLQFNSSSTFAGAASLYYFGANGAIVANAGIASTSTTTGTFQVTGGIGVSGNVYHGQRVGYVWAANNVSSVYQVFNNSTNSLDTVFG